jgi:hypothetical protein
MKNIKDYLHLYMGCEAQIQSAQNGVVINNPITGMTIHYASTGQTIVKPILRKLSSMTEEEARDMIKFIRGVAQIDQLIISNICDIHIEWHFYDVRHIARWIKFDELNPSQFQYLLSKGFDLFGLIEEGLAIDKNKGGEQ